MNKQDLSLMVRMMSLANSTGKAGQPWLLPNLLFPLMNDSET